MKDKRKTRDRKAAVKAPSGSINWLSWYFMAPLLAAVTWAVYSRCTDFEVTNWDDNHYIRELLLIRSLSWENIVLIFKTKVLMSYNPLVILSLAVDYAMGENSPGWYHGMNVFLHVVNSLLVLFVFRKLGVRPAVAAVVAFLFALHPMNVEAVAWIASRKDVLYAFFFLLSWLSYLFYRDAVSPGPVRRYVFYALSFILFVASGFSKIQAVLLPIVLLLTDYYKGGLFSRRAVLDKLPFLAGALAFGWYSLSSSTLKADQYSEPISFFTRIVYSFQAYWWYVVKCFFPVAQTAIYSFPEQGSTESMLLLIGGALLAALTVAGVIYFWKRNLLACFGLLFFAATTFPTLHLLALNSSLIYERFTYLSYIGLFVFAAALPDSLPSLRRWLPVLMWVTLLPFAALTYQRTGVWKSSYTLWTDVIEKNPRSHEALNNRGAWYNERGEIDKALTDINASISLNPRQPRAYNNRSMIHFLKKDYASSLRDVDSALVMEPKLAEAWCNRGNAFFDLKQYDSAISNYTMALKYSPNFPSNYANRGSAYLKKGDFLLARKDYEKAISQAANDGSSWRLCALAYAELEEHDKALAAMQRALELGQSDAAAMLSSEYVQMGLRAWADKTNSADKVLRYYQRAAEVDSRNYQAWYELGGMYYVKKDLPKARENWKKALEALPTYAEARMWLERTGGVN